MEPEVLLVGDTETSEFAAVREDLASTCHLTEVPDAQAALTALQSGSCAPAAIVLAQRYPGQLSDSDIDRLWRAAPLARILCLLGTWCEGESRTGRPFAGPVRVYWHQWSARWGQELARLRAGLCPTWGLPPTATDEERLMQAAREPAPQGQGLVVLVSRHPAVADLLGEACRQAGYATVCETSVPHRPRFQGAKAVVFDATDCEGEEARELDALASALPKVPILALMDFPRLEDRHRAIAHGATAVLAKPLLLDDLCWLLETLTRSA